MEYDSPNPVEDGLTRKVEIVVRSGSSGAKTESEYLMPGVVAVGGSRPAPPAGGSAAGADGSSGGGATNRPATPPIAKIFFPLALGIAALFALPYLLWLIPRGKTEPAEGSSTPPPPPAAPPRLQAPASRSPAAPKAKDPGSSQSGPPPKVW